MTSLTNTPIRNRFKLKKALIVAGAVILAFILAVMGFLYLYPAYAPSVKTISFIQDAVTRQKRIEQELLATYKAGKFTFTAPLVVQDPYQTAPLTALAIFDTPENSQISIHVPGKTPESTVDFTFAGYQKHHEVPIYGLYAGTLNHVTMRMQTQSGESAQTVFDLQTEPLPVDIDTFTILQVNRSQYNPGFNFNVFRGLQVFDIDGNVRWYSTDKSWQVFSKLKNGRYLFTYTVDQEGDVMMERDLLGKIYAIYNISDGIHHDVYELPMGNFLVTSSDVKSKTIEDYIFEVDRKSGHILRSFDLKDIFDPSRPHELDGLAGNDWLHVNSIVYDPSDQSIIISSRAQSAVVKLSYPGMQIKWILGSHDNWSSKYQPYLLNPVGTNFDWPWSQHHVTLYTPQLPGELSLDILLFDNALDPNFQRSNAYPTSTWYSMVARYRINETARTVALVWEYGRELGPALFSSIRGSAYRLANGNVLGSWGDIGKDAKGNPAVDNNIKGHTLETRIIELDPSNNEVVFDCTVPSGTYRTMRAGLYDGYSDENAYLTTRLNDTSGNDLVDRSVMAWRDVHRVILPYVLAHLKKIGRQIINAVK